MTVLWITVHEKNAIMTNVLYQEYQYHVVLTVLQDWYLTEIFKCIDIIFQFIYKYKDILFEFV